MQSRHEKARDLATHAQALRPHRAWFPARPILRVAVLLGVCTAMVIAVAAPALAHITVTPSSAPQGSAAELTFRVPNEETQADTVKIQVKIPTSTPIAQLLVRPVPGWTSQVQTVQLAKPVTTDDGTFSVAVSEVTWYGGKILPGQYQDFAVSADPLPSGVTQLVFKALQTYSNGDVVRWIDTSEPGQPEPAHPAPVLTLTGAGGSALLADRPSGASAASATSDAASDWVARGLALAALAVAALGLAGGLLRRRSEHT
jgi:uncharacterized protein YcnI